MFVDDENPQHSAKIPLATMWDVSTNFAQCFELECNLPHAHWNISLCSSLLMA